MRCHVCNVAVGDGQRFCHECGESLGGVTDPTETIDVIGNDVIEDEDVTVEAGEAEEETVATGGAESGVDVDDPVDDPFDGEPLLDAAAPSVDDDTAALSWGPDDDTSLAATQTIGVAPVPLKAKSSSLDSFPYEPMDQAPVGDPAPTHEPTTTMPSTDMRAGSGAGSGGIDSTAEMVATHPGSLFDDGSDATVRAPQREGFRLRASFVFALLALVATLMASIADVSDVRTTRPVDGIIVGIRALDDFGTNLAIAGFVGAALMLIGGLLSCFGLRWGAGVAGGAGLSMTGWAAVTLGLVEAPIHAAEGVTANAGGVTAFTLSVTRDLGYFLILAIGILGSVVFIVSLRMAGTGGRGGLDPWIAALGALASVVLAAGPLITLGGLPLDANLGTANLPAEFHTGRLVQLGLIVVTGVVGFLSVRTYGLGLVAGGLGVATWMWVSSLARIGTLPRSVGAFNLGAEETTPHAVTTVGVTASLALLLIAATIATVTRRRV